MQKAILSGHRQAELIDVPDPQAKEDCAMVKIHASPMCTEYHAFGHGHKTGFLGHEGAGEVSVVAQPSKVEIGDRVVIMAQYPYGRCSFCIAGDYIHCLDNYNFADFSGRNTGTSLWQSISCSCHGCCPGFQQMSLTIEPR